MVVLDEKLRDHQSLSERDMNVYTKCHVNPLIVVETFESVQK